MDLMFLPDLSGQNIEGNTALAAPEVSLLQFINLILNDLGHDEWSPPQQTFRDLFPYNTLKRPYPLS